MNNLPAHLANRPRRNVATTAAGHLGGLAPPYVSINGGQFTLVDASGDAVPLRSVTLDCIIVDVLDRKSRVFWGVDENNRVKQPAPNDPQPPVCFSDNGVGASMNATSPQSSSCNGCRWDQWAWPAIGGGTRPACTSTQKLAVYVAQAPGHPWLLRVPVTSHKALANYFHKFRGQNFDVPDVWTRITINSQPGQMGYWLTFEPSYGYDASKGSTDAPTATLCDDWVERKLTDQVIGRGDPVWTGQQRPATALQAPPPQPTQALAAPPPPAPAPAAAPVFAMPPAPLPFAPAPSASTTPATEQPFGAPPPSAGAATTASPSRRRGRQPAQAQNPVPPTPPANGPRPAPFGIVPGPAAPPPSDMQAALNQAFGLPPK